MTIDINPYASTLSFPAGTPASVINAVLAIRARADQQANQPSWLDQGINNIINGATSQIVFPWLQNEFVNLPYQTNLRTMQTDQAIRQYQDEQSYLTDQERQRLQDKFDLTNRAYTDFGNAMGAAATAYQPTPESVTDTGATTPYGPYEDPWTSSPGPQYSPPLNNLGNVAPDSGSANIQDLISQQSSPTQLQGDIASTNRDRIIKYTPEKNPTTSDMFRTVAGQNPLYAGILAQAYEKNPNLSNLLDPVQQRLQQAKAKSELSRGANLESQANARNAKLNPEIELLKSRLGLTDAQAALAQQVTELRGAEAQIAGNKAAWLSNLSDEDMMKVYGKSGGAKFPTNLQARYGVIQGNHPDWNENQIMAEALRQQDQVSPLNQLLVKKEAIPMDLARTELPKVQTSLRDANMFDTNLEIVNKGMQKLAEAGITPKSSTFIDMARAVINRQGNPEIMRDPDVQAALGAFAQLRNAVAVGYDRSIGDKGARIGAAYNLPSDPTYIPAGEWAGQYKAMKAGVASDVSYLNSMLDAMNTTIYGGGRTNTPIDTMTPGRGTNFGKPTPNARKLN